jgi:hypothetical protein
MKKVYVLQHFVGGEAEEIFASHDKEFILNKALQMEQESSAEQEGNQSHDDPDAVWQLVKDLQLPTIYCSYDQYAEMEGDQDEIYIYEIDLIET